MQRLARLVLVVGAGTFLFLPGCSDDDSGLDVSEDAPDARDVEETGDAADADADAVADGDIAEDGSGVCEQEFWVWDLSVVPPDDVQICASAHGEGEHAHVWVEDEQWGPSVDAAGIEQILLRWDRETPAGSVAPDQGIFEILTGIFGDPPDEFDGDAKIHILLCAMADSGDAGFDGYFRSTDMTDGRTSNRREMIHINSTGGRPVASPYMIGVMAHELHHMLQWRYDPEEEIWLSESFAELAMVLTGYPTDIGRANAWARNPTPPLLVSGVGESVDYGAAFLFGAYLHDRLSAEGVAGLVADPAHGTASVQTAAERVDPDTTFVELFAEFAMAVLLDDESIGDGRYGFPELDLADAGTTAVTFPAAAVTVEVPAGGVELVHVALDGSPHAVLGVDVSAGAALELGARVALIDDVAGTQVFAAAPGTHLALHDVPATATAIAVALATDEALPVGVALTVADE